MPQEPPEPTDPVPPAAADPEGQEEGLEEEEVVEAHPVRPGDVVRISMYGEEFKVQAGMADMMAQGYSLQINQLMDIPSGSDICEALWAKRNDEGRWVVDMEMSPMVVKASREEGKGLKVYTKEYDLSTKVCEAVVEQHGFEVVARPAAVGYLEVWRGDGWEATESAALVTTMHESLYSYVDRNIASLSAVGLIYLSAYRALDLMHISGYYHGDSKADNVVVKQSMVNGEIVSDHQALWIDFESCHVQEAADRWINDHGTPGFMSIGFLASYTRARYMARRKEYLAAWGKKDDPASLSGFFLEGQDGYECQDDIFGLGVSLLEALTQHRRTKHNINEEYYLTSENEFEKIKAFFDQPGTGSWDEFDRLTDEVSDGYRRIWDSKDYEAWLGEEYAIFFPFLASCLAKSMFNKWDSKLERKRNTRQDRQNVTQLSTDLAHLKEQEGELASRDSGTNIVPNAADDANPVAPAPKKRSTKFTATSFTSATYNQSAIKVLPKFSHPFPKTARPATSTAASETGTMLASSAVLGGISISDHALLRKGDKEPFMSGRIRVTKVIKSKQVRSWQKPKGLSVWTNKGNVLVPQEDGGYCLEVWMRKGGDGEVVINPDLGYGPLIVVCDLGGCGAPGIAKYVCHMRSRYQGHYQTNTRDLCRATVAHGSPLTVTEVDKESWHA